MRIPKTRQLKLTVKRQYYTIHKPKLRSCVLQSPNYKLQILSLHWLSKVIGPTVGDYKVQDWPTVK